MVTRYSALKKYIFSFILIFFLASSLFAQEQKSYELQNIIFEGNENIASGELSFVVTSRESPNWFSKTLYNWFGLGEGPMYFDSLNAAADVQLLKNYYQDQGFFQTKIGYRYELDTTSMDADVYYVISEGSETNFNKINLLGIEELPNSFKSQLESLAEVDTTLRFSKNYVRNLNSQIISYLRNNGMMLVYAEQPAVDVDTVVNKAEVFLRYNPGKRYKIGSVQVLRSGEGRDLVSDRLIEDIVNVEVGEFYNHRKLQQSQRRLYRTNLFSSALVTGSTMDTAGTNVPLRIQTDVNLLHQFSPEIIMNNEDQRFNLGLSFNFIKRNFLGSARKLTLSTSIASQDVIGFITNPSLSSTETTGYADARIILDQPFIFGQPIYTRWDNYITLQKRAEQYNMTLIGSKLGFDFELPEWTYFTGFKAYLNFENTKVVYIEDYMEGLIYDLLGLIDTTGISDEERDSLARAIVDERGDDLLKVNTNNSVLGVDLIANKTNNLLFPSRGYTINLLLESGNVIPRLIQDALGDDNLPPLYGKVLFSATGFPAMYFSRESAFGLKIRVGNIFASDEEKFSIPFIQRFTAGGSNSVRGWATRQLVPDLIDQDFDFGAATPEDLEALARQGSTLGGYFLIEGSIETRNRILGKLGSALFLDFGNTYLDHTDMRLDNIAVAVGFGFRYYTDIIPIRIDFGFKAYDPKDPRSFFARLDDPTVGFGELFQFHFAIGEAF